MITNKRWTTPVALAAALLLVAACAQTPPMGPGAATPSLVGTWEGVGKSGEVEQVYEFAANGTARWTIITPDGKATYDITYNFDPFNSPVHLDLSGFSEGPLAGKVLYGIVVFDESEDVGHIDFEPGAEGEGANVRPKELTDSAMTLRRLN